MRDVNLLQRDRLTSGTTWHAPGFTVAEPLIWETGCEICTRGRGLCDRLEEETGVTEILAENGTTTGVRSADGQTMRCETVGTAIGSKRPG